MHLALENNNYIDKMIVVDMGIKSYPMHHQDVVKAIQSVDIENVSARSQVHEMLKPMLQNEGLIQFLLKNLYWKEKGVLAWRMNTQVLIDRMTEVLSSLPEGKFLMIHFLFEGRYLIIFWMKILMPLNINFKIAMS